MPAREKTIPERKLMLHHRKKILLEKLQEINNSIEYIDTKQKFYDDVLTGKRPYLSNLIKISND